MASLVNGAILFAVYTYRYHAYQYTTLTIIKTENTACSKPISPYVDMSPTFVTYFIHYTISMSFKKLTEGQKSPKKLC